MKGVRYRDDLLVILSAILLRLVFWHLQADADPLLQLPVADEITYLDDARRWVEAGFSPAGLSLPFWQPPAYVFLLGGWLGLGGSANAFLVLQGLLGVATSWLIYRAALRVFGPDARGWALAGGLLYSLCPAVLYYETKWLKPAWTLFLLALLLHLSYPRGKDGPVWLRGLLVGLLAQFDAYFIALLPLLVLREGRPPARWLALLAGCALPVLPVLALNATATRSWVPFSYNGPVNLYVGNNHDWVRTYNSLPGWEWEQITRRFDHNHAAAGQDAAVRSRLFTREVGRYLRNEPLAYARGLASKALLLVSPRNLPRDGYLMMPPGVRWLGWATNFALLALAALVLPRIRRDYLLTGALVLVALVGLVFFPTTRYRLAALPILLVAAGSLHPWSGISRRYRTLALGTACGLGVAGAVAASRLVDYPAWRSFSFTEAAWLNLERGNQAAARGLAGQALEQKRLPMALNTSGQLIMGGGGDPRQARDLFEEAIRTDPTLPASYLNLGLWHRQRGDVPAASAAFDEYLARLKPSQRGYSSHDARGLALSLEFTARAAFEQGRPAEALARLKRLQENQRKGWLPAINPRGLDEQIRRLEAQTPQPAAGGGW